MSELSPELEKLSTDAKVVGGAWFGMGSKTIVTLHLIENKPTAHTQSALDEMVRAGVLSVEPFNRYGGLVYKPLIETRPLLRWLSTHKNDPAVNIELMEPVKP